MPLIKREGKKRVSSSHREKERGAGGGGEYELAGTRDNRNLSSKTRHCCFLFLWQRACVRVCRSGRFLFQRFGQIRHVL